MEESHHFNDMLEERAIPRQWVERTLSEPDRIENHQDGTRHFLKQISEHKDRWLRVVVNVIAEPNQAVTTFFDRRLRQD